MAQRSETTPASDRNEPAALSTEERYRLLLESVQDYALFMLDPNGVVSSWNAGARRIKGYSAEEIIGQPFSVFYPEEDVAAGWPAAELRQALSEGRLEDEGWRLRKDGSRFWANVVITPVYDDEGRHRGFAKITRDLSERRAHEERFRQSQEQFGLLIQSVTDYAIFMLDTAGRVTSWNAGAEAIKGYSASEIVGRHFSTFYSAEDVARGKPAAILKRALEEGHAVDQGWRVRKDGSLFWAEVAVTPMFDTSGAPRGYAKVTRDSTDRRRLEELEVSSRRMVEFLATLAHELRNPLTPIRNSIALLKMTLEGRPEQRQPLAILDRQTYHLSRLVDDLLDVGRITSGKIQLKLRRMDFGALVRQAVETVYPAIAARAQRLAVSLPDGPLEIIGDDTRLSQALHNLLGNALKFTPEGGEISVEAKYEGRAVTAVVRDTGRGMAPESIERIFELFGQEKAGSGLGIGLSLARQLVQLHGGTLSAASPGPGLGSSFTITLPAAPLAALVPGVPAAAVREHRTDSAQRILVVDDNEDAADTMVELLGVLGHQARATYSAESALLVAQRFRPTVVLLDLDMPDQDGFSTLERLRSTSAGQAPFVAALTGHGQPADQERTRAAGFDAHLTKPVSIERLEEIFREIAVTSK